MTLIDVFRNSTKRFFQRILFEYPVKKGDVIEWRRMTYGEFYRLSLGIAKSIKEKGVHPGERVILFAENSPWWCASYMGINLNGAIAVPVDLEIDDEGFRTIVGDSSSALIISSTRTEERVKNYHYINCDNIDIPSIIDEGGFSYQNADSVASIIYTSGTTGIPKAVMLSHGNFVFQIEAVKNRAIINEYENVLCMLPLHHTYPFVCNFIAPLGLGARVTFTPSLKGEEILKTIKDRRVTVFVTVPLVLELLEKRLIDRLRSLPFFLRLPFDIFKGFSSFLRRRFDINIGKLFFFFVHIKTGFQLRFITSGGAKLNQDVMKDLEALGFTIIEGYGLTETSPIVTFNPPERRRPGSAGKALDGVEVKIYEPDSDGVGEIIVKGPSVMKGYYKNEVITSEVIKDGWLYTGDIGYLDNDGYLYITGRKKDVIVLSSGKNIYPEELEERYKRDIPLIKDICILDDMGAIIVPDLEYAKLKGLINIDAYLRWEIDRVSNSLPPYMRIKTIRLYPDALPKTRLGKLRRFLIKEMIGKPIIKRISRLPEGEVYRRLEKVFIDVLPEKRVIGLDSHLEIDLGIDSLRRLELASAVEREFGIDVSEDMLKAWHTVDDILRSIEGRISSVKVHHKKRMGMVFRFVKMIILFTAHTILKILFRVLFRIEVRGIENIPTPPFIIVSNHVSYLDGFVIFSILPFRISMNLYFHGLRRYFPSVLLSELMNVIRISSEGEYLNAMKISSEIINMGYSLCIFPEGGRSFDGRLRELKPGFALIALKHGIPVVPIFITGTFRALPRGRFIPRLTRIKAFIMKPADVSRFQNHDELVNDVATLLREIEETHGNMIH